MASTASITKQLKITDAPSRDRLFDSHKYAYDRDNQIICEFKLEDGNVYGIVVDGMFHEDGSGYSFCFFGRTLYWNTGNGGKYSVDQHSRYVCGYVYTKSPRYGNITFSSERLTFNLV